MSKANTLIVCLSPNKGGMEIDTIKLSKKLSLYSNIVLLAKENGHIANSENEYDGYNISLEKVGFKSSISPSIFFKTKNIIKKYNIKNVIFFGASELKSLFFAFLGHDINLIIRHGTTKSTRKKDFFHKLIYSKVNYHVSISQHLEKNIRFIIPFGKNAKLKIIYPSIDTYSTLNKTSNDINIIHTGRITQGKGQLDAILACEVLYQHKIDFNFLIVGDFENEKYAQKFMKIYNTLIYKDKIKIIGFTKDINPLLSKSNIFLFPSSGEGFGNSFIEALSHGLIGISYKNTTFYEFKNLGLYFHLVDNKNIEQLKKILLNIARDLKNETAKSSINIDLVKKIFSVENETNSYLEILK